ncbi:MAG TPA: proton-conducting transporter membrane subunit, partial [Cellvibrio sp.]
SLFYLLGTALLYSQHGTLDIVLLSQRADCEPASLLAVALMTTGLLAKTALVPLHFWLPPAHAGAPSSASALLSALVVKGSFFIIVRLWFNAMPSLPGFTATQLLAVLGGVAIVFGSVLALCQQRLKLLIAYSTLAQIGYLFLMFPLAFSVSGKLDSGIALAGGLLQAVSHAMAKAAMFMVCGSIYTTLGHDCLSELGGVWRRLPISVLAFALSGLALMGLPPGGAYVAKELLIQAAVEQSQWWWIVVLQAGGIFTGAYVFLVLIKIIATKTKPLHSYDATPRVCEVAALALALCSLFLGLLPWDVYLPIPPGVLWNKLDLGAFSKAFILLTCSAIIASLLSRGAVPVEHLSRRKLFERWVDSLRYATLRSSTLIERGNNMLRQWPTACIFLLLLTLLFMVAMLAKNSFLHR